MKRILFPLLCALIFLASCSKGKDEPSYFITCKIDGVEKSFNTECSAIHSIIDVSELINIRGADTKGSHPSSFGIILSNGPAAKPIGKSGVFTSTTKDFEINTQYLDLVSGASYGAGTMVSNSANEWGVEIENQFVLTITSNDGNIIEGTFSGDYYYYSGPLGDFIRITDGKFRLKVYPE
ncbi:hypothetical protein KJS94_02180 [Flavihumibacter rivuli]|uniref:hypothetical protein n=1 Tax=Flavihumibacter rivuli TaxID=2838156 RepID=UPI001BDEE65C|nr:hypothetical protein [Flavihumibacter rivuli]ULQ57003.1 hypothetical protein KJS94_02180 [Flavihumibacter rivuli]